MPAELVGAVMLLLVALAAGFFGLWWGERGRRIASENREIYGRPRLSPARVQPPPPEPEQRIAELQISEETIARGTKAILDEAKRGGSSVSLADARKMAEVMLSPEAAFMSMDRP